MQQPNIEFHTADHSFTCSFRSILGHYNMPSYHFHDQYEIYYLLSGERHYFIKDRTFRVTQGNLVLINKYDLHKTTDTGAENHERLLIKFANSFVLSSLPMNSLLNELFTQNNHIISFLPADQEHVEAIFTKILHEIEKKGIGYEISLQALLMELLVFSRRYIEEHRNDSASHPSPLHEKMSEIVQYINKHYHASLSLSSVSKHFFISPYYLSRAFKQATGFTFIEYVNSVRVREAQILLRETDDKVIQIAEQVGFGNISHFGRVFKDVTGFSPLNYRKLNRS